jgi:hypothetical protein
MDRHLRPTHRSIGIGTVVASLSLVVVASPVAATGTCAGTRSEYVLPAEQRDLDPLAVYDKNGDGIVCVSEPSGRFKVAKYSDNKS